MLKEKVEKTLLGMKKVINREYRIGNDMVHVDERYFMGVRYRFISRTRPVTFFDGLRGFNKNTNIDIVNDSNTNIDLGGLYGTRKKG